MPPSFHLPADYLSAEATDIWKPLGLDARNLDRGSQWLHAIAQLEPGATLAWQRVSRAAVTMPFGENRPRAV